MTLMRWIAVLITALALPAQAELRDIRYDYQRSERAQTDFTAADAAVQRVVLAQLMLAQVTTNPGVTGVFNPASPGPIGATTPDAITGTTITATTRLVAGTGVIADAGSGQLGIGGAAGQNLYAAAASISTHVVNGFGWGATFGNPDTFLARDAANTLRQSNGTNAQAFLLANTRTDASNYEYFSARWAANVLTLKAEALGTGTQRRIDIVGTATNDSAAAGVIGEYWEAQCAVATSGASQAFTSASPTVGTWASPPWTGTGVPFGSFACPFQITANAPTGLSTATNYWAVPIDATTFHVSTSAANAAAGTFANTSGSTATASLTSTLVFTSTAGLSVALMNLTAGDWDCNGSVIYVPGATTSVTNLQNGIGSSSTAIGTLGSYSDFETAANVMTATNNPVHTTPSVRRLLSATTATYLVGLPVFSASTLNGAGDLRCRRMR